MIAHQSLFRIDNVLHHLKHYLPAQASLKDFIHHNTLHAFQDRLFFTALTESSAIFGYKTSLSLVEYRDLYQQNKISEKSKNYGRYECAGENNQICFSKLSLKSRSLKSGEYFISVFNQDELIFSKNINIE